MDFSDYKGQNKIASPITCFPLRFDMFPPQMLKNLFKQYSVFCVNSTFTQGWKQGLRWLFYFFCTVNKISETMVLGDS